MPRQIQGSQWNFSYGEVDVALKRADDHPARKSGLRQMSNARILNAGGVSNRSGRRALYPVSDNGKRTERFTISPGNVYDIQFAPGRLKIISGSGVAVGNFATQGNGAALPWTANNLNTVVYAIVGLSIYVTFAGMIPQVITWNGVSTWSIADYAEIQIGSQKRTPFYRISPQGITLLPGAGTGSGVTLAASAPLFTPAWVGTRVRYVNRQMLITGYTDSQNVTVTIMEALPGSQQIAFAVDPRTIFSIGDVVIGATSGSKGVVVNFVPASFTMNVQLLSTSTTTTTTFVRYSFQTITTAFQQSEIVAGPSGSGAISGAAAVGLPLAVTLWDEEVMNSLKGYPASCFSDQFRLGFCNYPSVPGGIGWSAINNPTDMYVGPNPTDGMFEITPGKVQVQYVVPGPESNEFVFCDRRIYYIPISPTNPLRPGSVQFLLLSGDGTAQVQPRISQEAILYINAGQNSVMAVIATGAYLRPFNTKNLSDYHAHLFNNIQCIAAPSADGTFNERYAYVLNGDGSIAVGKYAADSLAGNAPVIGWGPWSGAGVVSWIAAYAADVLFTSTYGGAGVVEILDDSQYLDCALPVNAAPAAFAPPAGQGPLWFAANQSVSLMDQSRRAMGTYQVDAIGFIVPQFNGGEDLTRLDLVAGQPWTMITEPFAPDATPGADMGQRMKRRQISYLAAYVLNSTGIMFASLFSSDQTATSPPLGTIMNTKRFPAWNVGDDATKPPTLRETVHEWTPAGASYDPRVAIIHDAPGPLTILEIGMEITP